MESMSIKQYRKAISDKDYSVEDMKIALEIWRSNRELKDEYPLNDFVNNPQELIETILNDEELKLKAQIALTSKEEDELIKKNFIIVHDDDKCQFLAIGNSYTNGYIARNYLRQKNDGKKFGSGPTWCIASEKDGNEHWEGYEFDNGTYPLVYMLLSKKDSTKRWQYTFYPDELEALIDEDYTEEEEWDDELEEYVLVKKYVDLEMCVDQVRNFGQDKREDNGVFSEVVQKMNISNEDITNWLRGAKHKLHSFKSDTRSEGFKETERIHELHEEVEGLKEELVECVSDEVLRLLFKESEIESKSQLYALALIPTTKIYLKSNKKIKPHILRAILDFHQCTNNSDKEVEELKKSFSKYRLTLKDMSDFVKAETLLNEDFKSNFRYGLFIYICLSLYFKNKPVTVEEMISHGLVFEKGAYSTYRNIGALVEFGATDCITGDVIELDRLPEEEKVTSTMELLHNYLSPAFKVNDGLNYFITMMGNHFLKTGYNPGVYAGSMIYIISKKFDGEYGLDALKKTGNNKEILDEVVAFNKITKKFVFSDEDYKSFIEDLFKKVSPQHKDMKDYYESLLKDYIKVD